MTDDGYDVYGRGTVEPGDRPAILVVDYQKAFTTDGLGMGGTPLIERGVVNTARLLPVARETGVPVFQFHVSFGEAEGGLGLWSRKVPKLAEIRVGTPWVEIDDRLLDPSDSVIAKKWPSVFAGTPLARAPERAAHRHRDRHRLHDLGLRPRDDRRRVLERLPHARARGRRGRPGAGPARREPARLPAALLRGHDDGRVHRVPAAPRRGMRRPPLEDVTIVAIEQYGAGPWGSVHLADLGADVIKIEDPRSRGDVGRYVPPYQEGEDSLFFETFCHNKRSVSLDLTHPEARPVFEALVRAADGVYSNLRGDGPEKLRIRYADLESVNPAIVCCSLSGFGMTGPRAEEGGYDYILQGYAGWMSLTGEPDGPPVKTGLSLVDMATGYAAALALMCGLWGARRDGVGLRLRHLAVRDGDEPQHVRLDLAPLARLRAAAHGQLRAPVDRAVPELPHRRRLDRDRVREGQVLRPAVRGARAGVDDRGPALLAHGRARPRIARRASASSPRRC